MSILSVSLCPPISAETISSLNSISGRTQAQFLTAKLSHLNLSLPSHKFDSMTIRMGGGPRTYPGGVSKWQWKRMQAKKAKQLLKARLARERQIYEMRKRAELKAAVSELERPWEVVEKAPNLFSVCADEQLKVLADRFQRPGGFDMWSDRDGPELFKPVDGVPSARFFPKGVVHSIKPYGKVQNLENNSDEREISERSLLSEGNGRKGEEKNLDDGDNNKVVRRKIPLNRNGERNLRNRYARKSPEEGDSREDYRARRNSGDSTVVGYHSRRNFSESQNGREEHRSRNGLEKSKDSNLDVYDMRLQQDGSYRFQAEN